MEKTKVKSIHIEEKIMNAAKKEAKGINYPVYRLINDILRLRYFPKAVNHCMIDLGESND